jgi:hypothetical protein
MTQPFRILWSPLALADWRRVAPDSQAAVARAVERFPHEGVVIATGTERILARVILPRSVDSLVTLN